MHFIYLLMQVPTVAYMQIKLLVRVFFEIKLKNIIPLSKFNHQHTVSKNALYIIIIQTPIIIYTTHLVLEKCWILYLHFIFIYQNKQNRHKLYFIEVISYLGHAYYNLFVACTQNLSETII